jgi:hypothetical protein
MHYIVPVRLPEGSRPLGRLRGRHDNIKMEIKVKKG